MIGSGMDFRSRSQYHSPDLPYPAPDGSVKTPRRPARNIENGRGGAHLAKQVRYFRQAVSHPEERYGSERAKAVMAKTLRRCGAADIPYGDMRPGISRDRTKAAGHGDDVCDVKVRLRERNAAPPPFAIRRNNRKKSARKRAAPGGTDMTEWEAIKKRISCRSYEDRMIDADTLENLRRYIRMLNASSGLHFQLFASEEKGRPAIRLAASMFSGPVYAYAALVGGEDPLSAEKTGYSGESLVLYATKLGLGTCWVAGTYDAGSIAPELPEGEKVWSVITLGYAAEKTPMKQKMIRAAIRRRDRRKEQFLESETAFDDLPAWVQRGIEAILLGPSAVNQQPVNIVYRDGSVSARLWKTGSGLEYVDLGIAKKQFQAAALEAGVDGTFQWGSGGQFQMLLG